ncbi:Protocadherin-11 Y-linked [Fasciola gigantica]|uniref:Protocadherin-11 Y-linked n=1 Tax=Fasciola gigantica TaxID=46835 RepID=A0A504YR68_FASGI|nr:Protocadherin-11 Y-linked [Fasciola gigantica]
MDIKFCQLKLFKSYLIGLAVYPHWIVILLILGVQFDRTVAQYSVSYQIQEELPRGTLIGSLATHLPASLKVKLPILRFRIIQNEQAQYFHVNISTGELRVKKRMDRETICPSLLNEVSLSELLHRGPLVQETHCQLSFRVNILRLTGSGVEIENLIRVFVLLDDADDNRCQFFPSDSQELYIPENTNGTTWALYSPIDLDTEPKNNLNGTTISLQCSSAAIKMHPFGLKSTKTESSIAPYQLQLVVLQPLDYEQVPSYKMYVAASGFAQNSGCRLDLTIHVIDRNDHAPVFIQHMDRLSLAENTTVGQTFYTATATDADVGPVFGALRFSLSPSNPPQLHSLFAVHEMNGSVYLKRALNYGQQSNYKLSLRVQNPDLKETTAVRSNQIYTGDQTTIYGGTLTAKIESDASLIDYMDLYISVLDVNDHPPEIIIYALNGSRQLTLFEHVEFSPADFAVVSITDEDSGSNGEVSCHLTKSDRDRFEMTRIDQKSTNLVVNNTVSTGSPTSIEISDSRGALYKIAALRSFDREMETNVSFCVICVDHGTPSLTSNVTGVLWILDLNDHDPEVPASLIHLQVHEDTDPTRRLNDYIIGQINATDRDVGENARLRYSIVEPDVQNLVSIDSATGILRSKGTLDYETSQILPFTVLVTDFGDPPRSAHCRVEVKVIDVNDHSPQFERSRYFFTVQENLPQGSHVGSVRVCDQDVGINAVLSFQLSPSDVTDLSTRNVDSSFHAHRSQIPFHITSQYASPSHCYQVMILTSSPLNREEQLEQVDQSQTHQSLMNQVRPYQFTLVAEDRGTPRLTTHAQIQVKVSDVNDEAPVFVEPDVTHRFVLLNAHQPVGIPIFQVRAVDRDDGPNGTVRYSLGAVTIYELMKHQAGFRSCDEHAFQDSSLRTMPEAHNMMKHFHIDPDSGVFSLKSAIAEQLIDLLFRITIFARDCASVPMESGIHMCVSITDGDSESDGLNRTGTASGASMRLQAKRSRTTFYLYVIGAISIVGLLASVAFVLSAYFMWHRPRSKMAQNGTNVIHFAEVDNMTTGTNMDKMEYPEPIFESNTVRVCSGSTLVDWSNTIDPTRTAATTDKWAAVQYNPMDPMDKNPIPYRSYTDPITEWQSSMTPAKPNQYVPFVYSPHQSVHYHTMHNTHALNLIPTDSSMLNY